MITAALLTSSLLGQPHGTPELAAADSKASLSVDAWLSTAGPYGEGWTLRVTPNGGAFLRVYYSRTPSGSLMADFDLGEEHVERIRQALAMQGFFELPTEITPKQSMLHMPDFRLDVTLGARTHKVQLYDPEQLKHDGNAKRFLAIWGALYAGLPLKPKW